LGTVSAIQSLPEEVVDLVESGVSILVGTRDASLRPASVRGVGARVASDRRQVTVYLPQATSHKAVENLRDNGEIAVAFSRPLDNLAIQIKGSCTRVRLADKADRPIPERYAVAFVEMTYAIGMPRSLMKRMTVWPAWAASFDVRELYSQTPGPGAGKPWGER
jgi:hypothetical protein